MFPPSLMGRDVPSVIGTWFCSLVCSKMLWLGGSCPLLEQGITQCCSTLPVDAPSCVARLGLHGEQWDPFQGLDLICPCFEAWRETWAIVLFLGHTGVQITFAKKGCSWALPETFTGPRAQFSLPEHGLLLGFKFSSLKQCCMDAESPRS